MSNGGGPVRGCVRAELLINRHLDQELVQGESIELSSHLQECPACRAFLARLQDIQEQLRVLDIPKAAAAKRQSLAMVQRLVQGEAQRREVVSSKPAATPRARLLRAFALPLAAALLLLAVASLFHPLRSQVGGLLVKGSLPAPARPSFAAPGNPAPRSPGFQDGRAGTVDAVPDDPRTRSEAETRQSPLRHDTARTGPGFVTAAERPFADLNVTASHSGAPPLELAYPGPQPRMVEAPGLPDDEFSALPLVEFKRRFADPSAARWARFLAEAERFAAQVEWDRLTSAGDTACEADAPCEACAEPAAPGREASYPALASSAPLADLLAEARGGPDLEERTRLALFEKPLRPSRMPPQLAESPTRLARSLRRRLSVVRSAAEGGSAQSRARGSRAERSEASGESPGVELQGDLASSGAGVEEKAPDSLAVSESGGGPGGATVAAVPGAAPEPIKVAAANLQVAELEQELAAKDPGLKAPAGQEPGGAQAAAVGEQGGKGPLESAPAAPQPAEGGATGPEGTVAASGGTAGDSPQSAARPGRPGRPTRPERPERPKRPEKPERPSKPERPKNPQETARPERPGGVQDPADGPGKPTRPERPERPEKSKPERPSRGSRS